MAKPIFGLNNHHISKAVHALGLLCLLLFVHQAQAREFKVGDSGWGVRTTSTESYNRWAERNRFQIGDSLVFVYTPNQDSVLLVTKEAYDNCSTDTPTVLKYTDGHTVISLNRSGPFYFISGNQDNCLKGEKLVVVVLADRSNNTTNATAPASPPPAASPQSPPASAPAPAPYVESPTMPTPAPREQSPASPPLAASPPLPPSSVPASAPHGESAPTGSVEINPTPPPTGHTPAPSAASSAFISVTGFIGAFLASYLLL